MKSNLLTSVVIFVVGAVVAFITCNMIVPGIEDFNLKTIDINSDATLVDPDTEIFNYRAINPTVEVYVGDGCEVYDENGNCIDNGVLNTEENNNAETNTSNETPDETPGENDDGTVD